MHGLPIAWNAVGLGVASIAAYIGVLVGGRSSRMGGRPKGLLCTPGSDETLVAHALRVGAEARCAPRWLVGDLDAYDAVVARTEREPEYRGRLRDAPSGVGPLGGLRALLQAAVVCDCEHVIAVACDMPHVSRALLTTLREHPSTAAVLAARRGPAASGSRARCRGVRAAAW